MDNVVLEKSFAFAVEIVEICEELTKARRYVLSNQLMRSGTSIGANISESEYAQSREDFIAKLSIALKEAAESRYWIRLLEAASSIDAISAKRLTAAADEIIKLLTSSINTAKLNKKS